jgi:hypothetical protein
MENSMHRHSNEEWRSIEGYEGLYDVSNLGRVRSYHAHGRAHKVDAVVATPRFLRPAIDPGGHLRVFLCKGSLSSRKSVFKLVARAFLKPPVKPDMVVSFIDGNYGNPSAANLVYRTRPEAMRYAQKPSVRGARYGGRGNLGLDLEQVREIREKYAAGETEEGDRRVRTVTQDSLAVEYGVTVSAINQIIQRVTYKQVA